MTEDPNWMKEARWQINGLIERLKRLERVESELRRLVDICDTTELADGSSIDTRNAHALLGDFMKVPWMVEFRYLQQNYKRIVRADDKQEARHHLEHVFREVEIIRIRLASEDEVNELAPLSKIDADMIREARERSVWK